MKTPLPTHPALSPRRVLLTGCVALAALTLAGVGPASAQQFVQGFETGFNLTANTRGDTALVGASFDPASPPPQGASQLLLTTFSVSSDGSNFSGNSALSVAGVESFLGLQSGSIPSGGALGDASALRLTPVALNAGDVVSFSYNFLTSATGTDGRDLAFLTLQRGTAAPVLLSLAGVTSATTASASAAFDRETGLQSGQFPAITQAGTYTLGFGVTDAGDDVIGSGLLLDNVQVSAVPEPATWFCLLAGGGGLGLAKLRARRWRAWAG